MRDAIVYGYDWTGGIGPVERVALAVATTGGKVLHCDEARSVFKRPDAKLHQVEPNLYTFRPWLFASRLNRYPGMPQLQGAMMARQILGQVQVLGLSRPAFMYGWMGPLLAPLCQAMRRRGYPLVHIYADSFEAMEEEHVEASDQTLVYSRTTFERLQARWRGKIHHIPHGVDLRPYRLVGAGIEDTPLLAAVPHPRLGYAGANAHDSLNTGVLRELLERRPEWSFVSFQWKPAVFGMKPAVPLPNAHILPWQAPGPLARCVAGFDVGFMPYDCSNPVLYNGPPMKLWDYFALGLPVVATPLIHLWDYEGLVYLGDTAKELEKAVEAALAEPPDSPLRQRRKELAEQHSMEAFGQLLNDILA